MMVVLWFLVVLEFVRPGKNATAPEKKNTQNLPPCRWLFNFLNKVYTHRQHIHTNSTNTQSGNTNAVYTTQMQNQIQQAIKLVCVNSLVDYFPKRFPSLKLSDERATTTTTTSVQRKHFFHHAFLSLFFNHFPDKNKNTYKHFKVVN